MVFERDTLLDVRSLSKHYPVRKGLFSGVSGYIKAVDGVSFTIRKGETFGLVGESGCGKTTLGRTILMLERPTAGQVVLGSTSLTSLGSEELQRARRDMQMVFQDPYGALDPRMPVHEIIAEPLDIHRLNEGRHERVLELLGLVGLAPYHANRYPHEFSGGQRQRIGIARALALRPSFLVCDEPVSALDVSIQSQIINLLGELQQDFGLTYLFIAHNLSVVYHISDRVGVMYLGRVVEMSGAEELFNNPLHPYTEALLSAAPVADPKALKGKRILLKGDVPSPMDPPAGCGFHTRCWLADPICREQAPEWREVSADHWLACHLR